MKKIRSLLLVFICFVMLVSCSSGFFEQTQNNAKPAYFIGRVVEKYERGCMVEVTDEGNYGQLAIGSPVQVTTSIQNCPEYEVGDHIKIVFDGTVAESYPPQILHVLVIEKTD